MSLCCTPGCEEEGRDRSLAAGSVGIYCNGHWESPDYQSEEGEHPEDKAEREKLGLDEDQYDRRLAFERNCSCHISPPCCNCIEYGELFPDEI